MKKNLELENRNQIQKGFTDQADPEASLSNQEKEVEEDSRRLDIKKCRNKKQYKTNMDAELELYNFLLYIYIYIFFFSGVQLETCVEFYEFMIKCKKQSI